MATVSTADINDLPDSDFAYIEAGGTKDGSGKTIPRSLRHYPIMDEAHVRNALSRAAAAINQGGDAAKIAQAAMPKIKAAAKKMDIGAPAGKSDFDMKAELLTEHKTKLWLDGELGRRVLVLPYSGPLPGGKAGLDQDGEYFDNDTDRFGDIEALKASPWRLMDWHHDDDHVPAKVAGGPPISMKSLVIGEIELDDDADDFGLWANWWIRQGQANDQRIGARRVAALQEMGVPVYGSSYAAYKKKASDGHIDVWPIIRHTATTTPRNTHAAIPSLKAVLADLNPDAMTKGAMKALLEGYATTTELLSSSTSAAVTASALSGEEAVKAGRVLSKLNATDLKAIARLVQQLLGRGNVALEDEENDV